jgi:hypothetical protein
MGGKSQVAGHHGEPLLQGGGGDQQVGTVMAQGRGELAPAAGDGQIHRQQPFAVQPQQPIQPGLLLVGEYRISGTSPGDTAPASR